jgi:hypothetical protein
MRKEVAEASQSAVEAVGRIMEEKTKQGDNVLFAGVGNTIGIGQ